MSPHRTAAAALVLATSAAWATGSHQPPPGPPPAPPTTIDASANAGSSAKAAAGANAGAMATGGTGGSIDYTNGGARSYALFSGATAAPLPATTCPQGDSSYVQVLWGLLTVAQSTTRTEMECLDKVLAVMRATPVQRYSYGPAALPIEPVLTPSLMSGPAQPPAPACKAAKATRKVRATHAVPPCRVR